MTDYLLIILSAAVVAHAIWARYQDQRVGELSRRCDLHLGRLNEHLVALDRLTAKCDELTSAVRNLTGDGR
jgi:hypothetical protein